MLLLEPSGEVASTVHRPAAFLTADLRDGAFIPAPSLWPSPAAASPPPMGREIGEGSYIWGEAQKTSRAATHSRTSVSALAMFMATNASFLALLSTPLALLTAVLLVRLNLAHA
jgi:hypothetical protein